MDVSGGSWIKWDRLRLNIMSKKVERKLVTVAHACNPNYSGGRDWDDCDSSQPKQKSLQDPIPTNGKPGHGGVPVIPQCRKHK
jgi:hypothetical protein